MIPRMRRLTLVLLSPLLAASFLAAQSARAPEIDSITEREMRADLFFLASDALEGRLTNTAGNRIAGDWVLSQFQGLGLQPGGHGNSFEHRYALMTATLGSGNAMRIAMADSSLSATPAVGAGFYPHRFSANATVEGEAVFAGFGISSPERGHNDYGADGSVRGRVVVILDREPGVNDPGSVFDGVVTAEAAQPIKKVLAAQDRGAIGVIFVEDVHNASGPPPNFQAQAANYWPEDAPRVERYTLAGWSSRIRIPVVQASRDVAEQMFAGAKRSVLEAAPSAETRGGITPVSLNTRVSLTTSVVQQIVPDRSIVAMLEGSDPKLKS